MNFFTSYFRYTKSQKKGVLFLVLLIIIFQLVYFFVDFSSGKVSSENKAIITKFEKEYDSLNRPKIVKGTVNLFPFNPNFITDFKGSQLGMSVQEIDRLHAYRAMGKFVNSAKEFQRITKVSDSLLLTMQSRFKFPSWVQKSKSIAKKKLKKPEVTTTNINKATSKDFQKINAVDYKLANRIVAYRKKIQGFSFPNQLSEVYYITPKQVVDILQVFSITEKPIIKKVNVNTTTFKQLLHLPYIDYELTKKILNYRDEVAEIQSLEELKKIDDFPLEKFNLIALYLEAK